MEARRAVQQQFGGVADSYSTSTVFSQGVDLDAIAREAESVGPSRALDVGTAAGHVAFTIAPWARLVVGLDLTHQMLVRARDDGSARGIGNLRVCQGDVERLPFPDDSFDLVACRFSAHHFPRPDAFGLQAARVLRRGGRLILADVVAPADEAQDRWINRVEVLRDPSHVRDYKLAEWQRLLRGAGLETDLLLEWRLDLDFDDWTRRQRTPPERIEQIRSMFRQAPAGHREAFRLRLADDRAWSFALHCAVVRAVK